MRAESMHQQQQGHPPVQHLLSPQHSSQSDLIGASWPFEGSGYSSSHLMSPRMQALGQPGPQAASPRADEQYLRSNDAQHHWQHGSMQQQRQRDLSPGCSIPRAERSGHEAAAGSAANRSPPRCSPIQRRLAEAMALEAKAAAAAVLRSPVASSTASLASVPVNSSSMLAAADDFQGRHSRTPDRMRSPARSPQHCEYIGLLQPACAAATSCACIPSF